MKKILMILVVVIGLIVVIYLTVIFESNVKLKKQQIQDTKPPAVSPTGIINDAYPSVIIDKEIKQSMKLTSSVFNNQEIIPSKYTCKGQNINPPLQFSGIPEGTKSLVLIVDDPDAPSGTWVHWVVYNIDPSVSGIGENSVPQGGINANTSFGKPGYGGPCPPSGTHRYFFKLYALDNTLLFDRPEQVNKKLVEDKLQGHVLGQVELIGLFSK